MVTLAQTGDRNRLVIGYLFVLLTAVTADNVLRAARLPFWYDELFTVVLSRLPSFGAVVDALRQGADSNPPGFFALERFAAGWVSQEQLGFRLVSIAALPILCVSLFVFASRRWGPFAALVAATVPLTTVLYPQYAIEARPYAPMLAAVGLAACCWQRAGSSWRWTAALALSLATATSLHYYAIFALVPFGLAQLSRLLLGRDTRPRVWLALAVGCAPFVITWPFLTTFRLLYGAHFFAPPQLRALPGMYDWLFRSPIPHSVVAGSVVLCAMLVGLQLRTIPILRRDDSSDEDNATLVLVVSFVLLPLIMLMATAGSGGGLVPRHTLPAILGIALGTARVASVLPTLLQAGVAGVISVAVILGPMTHSMTLERERPRVLDRYRAELQHIGAEDRCLPVVVSDGLNFLPLAYSRASSDPEPIALVDPESSVRFSGTDSIDRGLTILRRFTSWPIVDFETFTSRHDRYLLYQTTDSRDWWPRRLRADGFSLQTVSTADDVAIYRVTRPGATDQPACTAPPR